MILRVALAGTVGTKREGKKQVIGTAQGCKQHNGTHKKGKCNGGCML